MLMVQEKKLLCCTDPKSLNLVTEINAADLYFVFIFTYAYALYLCLELIVEFKRQQKIRRSKDNFLFVCSGLIRILDFHPAHNLGGKRYPNIACLVTKV